MRKKIKKKLTKTYRCYQFKVPVIYATTFVDSYEPLVTYKIPSLSRFSETEVQKTKQ